MELDSGDAIKVKVKHSSQDLNMKKVTITHDLADSRHSFKKIYNNHDFIPPVSISY
jgi:hypothetical protein